MKFEEKLARFIKNNSTEIEKPMNLGYAIYFYYLFGLFSWILCGIFFSTLDDSLQRTLVDGVILVVMTISYFWNKKKYNLKEKWPRRKMDWKKFICICSVSRLVTWLGALIIYGIVNFLGIDYSSLKGTPASMGYSFSALLSAIVLAPICEELIFRGIGLLSFEKKDNKLEVIILTSVIFGLMHSNWCQAIVATLDGLLLGYAAIEFGIFYAILLHAVHNAWAYLAYFLKPFVNLNYVSFAISLIVLLNAKKVINQFKFALKSERSYSVQKQIAYFMNPIIFVCSVYWILEILNVI